jgi:hypothetical protein
MRVFFPHGLFMLPSGILMTILGPLDLYKLDGLILKLLCFLVHNVYHMHLKSTFLLHLNHIPINNMINIKYIFIKQ